jgi:cytochrome P450
MASANRPIPTATLRTPPALPRLPFFGNAFEFRRDPLGTLERGWRELGDVYSVQLGPRRIIVISDPALAADVLGDRWRKFRRPSEVLGGTVLTPLVGLSVLTTDGDSWLAKRRLLQPVFHRQRIAAMAAHMEAAGAAMLRRWQSRADAAPIDVVAEMKKVTLDIINRTMFSNDVLSEADRLGPYVDEGLHLIERAIITSPLPPGIPTPDRLRLRRVRRVIDEYLYGLIRARRAAGPGAGDLLDLLLEARDEETGAGMDDEQVRNEVATIYGAGHETTALALTWTWLALERNPHVRARLHAELDAVLRGRTPTAEDLPQLPYTLQILEESMRLLPPVPFTVREASEDVALGEFAIPAGAKIGIAIGNMQRHPRYWDAPDDFRPERFAPDARKAIHRYAYLPFLNGPHMCIGSHFALMEGQLLLAMIAQRYEMRVENPDAVVRDLAITMRPRSAMHAKIDRRRPTTDG